MRIFKLLAVGFILIGTMSTRADVAEVLNKGTFANIPMDVTVCSMAIDDGMDVTVSCDDRIRIIEMTDFQSASRASNFSAYLSKFVARGFSIVNCSVNLNVTGSNDSISTSNVHYCVLKR
jgi:hypothetical protein